MAQGYEGGKTTVENYIAAHADPVPAKRKLAAADPQGSCGKDTYRITVWPVQKRGVPASCAFHPQRTVAARARLAASS